MDASFELLIRQLDTSIGLEVRRPVFEWGGELHVQGPHESSWGQHVRFTIEDEAPDRILRKLPSVLQRKPWKLIAVHGDCLDLLRNETNDQVAEWGDHTLEAFLRSQLKDEDDWVAVFAWQCDQIDQVLEDANVELFWKTLCSQLRSGSTVKGLLAIHRQSRLHAVK